MSLSLPISPVATGCTWPGCRPKLLCIYWFVKCRDATGTLFSLVPKDTQQPRRIHIRLFSGAEYIKPNGIRLNCWRCSQGLGIHEISRHCHSDFRRRGGHADTKLASNRNGSGPFCPVGLSVAIIKRIRSSKPLPCTFPALHFLVDVLTDVQATELGWLKGNSFHETIG